MPHLPSGEPSRWSQTPAGCPRGAVADDAPVRPGRVPRADRLPDLSRPGHALRGEDGVRGRQKQTSCATCGGPWMPVGTKGRYGCPRCNRKRVAAAQRAGRESVNSYRRERAHRVLPNGVTVAQAARLSTPRAITPRAITPRARSDRRASDRHTSPTMSRSSDHPSTSTTSGRSSVKSWPTTTRNDHIGDSNCRRRKRATPGHRSNSVAASAEWTPPQLRTCGLSAADVLPSDSTPAPAPAAVWASIRAR
jgi:predicted RNA-binding Zn-ribbon protein involved in translation (DUF1610 family)